MPVSGFGSCWAAGSLSPITLSVCAGFVQSRNPETPGVGRLTGTPKHRRTAMKNIEVRQVTQNDALFLQQLMNHTEMMAILHVFPTSVDYWADAILIWDNDPDEEDYIILDEGVPVGWLGINGLSSESKQAWVKVIALLPTHQGRGIAHYVMSEIIENLALRGFRSVALNTDRSNERAQRCYSRCGFEISKKTVREMPNGTTVDQYKMERTLGMATDR